MHKKCPLMILSAVVAGIDKNFDEKTVCMDSKCAFWVVMFSTDNVPVRGCAIALNAMKNAEGRIQV